MIARRRFNALDYWDSPLGFVRDFWPVVKLYDKQREVMEAVARDDEVYAVAGNMLGKDFVAGLTVLWFFLTRHPCRIVTTSVKDDHLSVLWGEINRHVAACRVPLKASQGGPLLIVHHEIRKVIDGVPDPLSYVKGMVAKEGAAMQGHHVAHRGDGIPRTLFVVDEASGVQDAYHQMATTWANRMLVIGNPWRTTNFFFRAVKGNVGTSDRGGDIKRRSGSGHHRKVIKITVEDSPNVKLALKEQREGKKPSGRIVMPGVKSWEEYQKNLIMWDSVQQTVSLWAEFDESSTTKLVPDEWLELSCELHEDRSLWNDEEWLNRHPAGRSTMGHDSAMGGDNTVWCGIDRRSLLFLQSEKTPDTNSICGTTIGLMRKHGIKASDVYMDYGGGGKVHADRLRAMGWRVNEVGFGEKVAPEPRRTVTPLEQRKDERVDRMVFRNRRSQMYWMARELFEPILVDGKPTAKFAVPREILDRGRRDGGPSLREQLNKIPLRYDEEGRFYLPPKNKRPGAKDGAETMMSILGCSPDESDAFVLAVYGQGRKSFRATAGVA